MWCCDDREVSAQRRFDFLVEVVAALVAASKRTNMDKDSEAVEGGSGRFCRCRRSLRMVMRKKHQMYVGQIVEINGRIGAPCRSHAGSKVYMIGLSGRKSRSRAPARGIA